jgi:hypothetical protein
LKRLEAAKAAQATAEEARLTAEQKLARHAAQGAAVAAEKAAQQAKLRRHHETVQRQRGEAEERRCACLSADST